jgi:hypothetical protein
MSEPITVEEWADQINRQIAKTVAATVNVGRLLAAAKEELGHGAWGRMFSEGLVSFTQNTAGRLMAIAEHPVIANSAHVQNLPPSWGTLYQLTKIPNESLQAAIGDGRVTSATSRSQATSLRRACAVTATVLDDVPPSTGPIKVARTREAVAARVARIRELAHDGYSAHQIGAAIGVSGERVYLLIAKYHIDCPAARTVKGAVHRIDANRFVDQLVTGAEGLTANLELIDFHALDGARLDDWIASLKEAASALHGLVRQLTRERDRHVANEESGEPIESAPGADPVDAGAAGVSRAAEVQ